MDRNKSGWIKKLLRAPLERAVRENTGNLQRHIEHQILYGPYPKNSLTQGRIELCDAWTKLLIEICIALGSDIDRIRAPYPPSERGSKEAPNERA